MDGRDTSVTFAELLRNRQFLAVWLAQLVSSIGDWLALVALFSLVAFRWNASAEHVSGLLISFVIPFALLGPIAGVFVDRWDLKRTMIASDLLRAVLAAALMLATELWQLYALAFLLSTVSCFFAPAQGALMPLLVRKEELLVANALQSQTSNLNKVLGPAVAGMLVGWFGESACFLLDAGSFVASAALLMAIRAARAPGNTDTGVRASLSQLREGLDFLRGHRAIRFVVAIMIASILAVGVFDALVAVYVRDIIGARSQVFGALVSVVGAGTIAGSLTVGRFAQHWPRIRLIVAGIFVLGLGVGALALSGNSWPALGACLFLGVGVACVLVPAQTFTQEETPAQLLGRVSGTSMALITISQLLAFLTAGRLAGWMSIRNLYFVVSIALMVTGVMGYAYARANHFGEPPARASSAGPLTCGGKRNS